MKFKQGTITLTSIIANGKPIRTEVCGEAQFWNAAVLNAVYDSPTFTMSFTIADEGYNLIIKRVHHHVFQGVIMKTRKKIGQVHLNLFEDKAGTYLLKGDWEELNEKCDCIIELKSE